MVVVASVSAGPAPKVNSAPRPVLVIPKKPQPQVGNVENFVVIWLHDPSSKITNSEKAKSQLREIANTIKSFNNVDDCYVFMSTIKDEKIFLIVSGTARETFVLKVHDAKQLESIYIFCPDKIKEESWISQYPAIRGIYKTMLSLCEQLKKDTKNLDRQLVGFELVNGSQSDTTSKTNQQDALFMYDQLFREIVLGGTDEDMQDLHEFCETQYRDNPREQKFLKLLKTEYSSHTPAWWYTQDSFIYRMLNKALRTHQYDTLYVLRVFIRHIHQQLVEEHKTQSDHPNLFFRGQALDNADFEKIRENEGGLLTISNFLSTSSDREVALTFARGSIQDKRKASILMEITVDKNTTVPMASISELGVFKGEKEWLFSMGSVFRIGSLVPSPDGIWVLKLTFTNDYDQQLNDLKIFLKKSMEDENNCLNFAKLMHQLAWWKKVGIFLFKGSSNRDRRTTSFSFTQQYWAW